MASRQLYPSRRYSFSTLSFNLEGYLPACTDEKALFGCVYVLTCCCFW